MSVLNRLIGTTLAAGALVLSGVLPASAQAAPVTAHRAAAATPVVADYSGYSTAYTAATAERQAFADAYSQALATGFPQSECSTLGVPSVVPVNNSLRARLQPSALWEADVQIQCATPPVTSTPTVNLQRYNGPEHLSSTWAAPAGYYLEGSLGFLYTSQVAGTAPLYMCRAGGWDTFSSRDAGCEGQVVLGTLGYIYTAPPAGIATNTIRRCLAGDTFDSAVQNCEGQTVEGILGYSLA